MRKKLRDLYLLNVTDDGAGGGAPPEGGESTAPPEPQPGDDRGFPAGTPVAEMTVEQKAAYWKHQARKHEDRAKASVRAEDHQALKDELEALRQAQLSDQDKALEQAKAEAKSAGEAAAAQRYQRELVLARLQIATQQDEGALKYLDHTAFLTDSGEVDADRVAEYAELHRAATPENPSGSGSRDIGKRGSHGGAKPSTQSGRELYRQRHGKQ